MIDRLNNRYFKWLSNIVCGKRYSKFVSYNKLLTRLHNTNFRYVDPKDANRFEDGLNLRYRFCLRTDNLDHLDLVMQGRDCTVLEMMVALAMRIEEQIMDDPDLGDRTGQWFWQMIVSLGLGSMSDDMFDRDYVEEKIDIFLNREYEPNGKGGLFTINRCTDDLRDVEIWYQMCWYLNSIT